MIFASLLYLSLLCRCGGCCFVSSAAAGAAAALPSMPFIVVIVVFLLLEGVSTRLLGVFRDASLLKRNV